MTAILTLKNIVKTYQTDDSDEGVRVLKGINFEVLQGEFVALTGPSGSGKSTLLNLLGCLDTPTSGDYIIKDENVALMDDAQLSKVRSRFIGFIFQSFNLIDQLTVLENVELPLFYQRKPVAERSQRAIEMLSNVGLSHRTEHMPSQLSGGERQRVAIARALVTDPILLLADEPTGNLDSKTGEEIMQLLHDLHSRGATILIVTHDPDIAASLPRRIQMKDGIVV